MEGRRKTDYIIDFRASFKRRVWEDKNGWFITIRGERCEIQKNHFALRKVN